jgi:hypothetical protein
MTARGTKVTRRRGTPGTVKHDPPAPSKSETLTKGIAPWGSVASLRPAEPFSVTQPNSLATPPTTQTSGGGHIAGGEGGYGGPEPPGRNPGENVP